MKCTNENVKYLFPIFLSVLGALGQRGLMPSSIWIFLGAVAILYYLILETKSVHYKSVWLKFSLNIFFTIIILAIGANLYLDSMFVKTGIAILGIINSVAALGVFVYERKFYNVLTILLFSMLIAVMY